MRRNGEAINNSLLWAGGIRCQGIASVIWKVFLRMVWVNESADGSETDGDRSCSAAYDGTDDLVAVCHIHLKRRPA
jgi:hypothetical protein